MMNMLCGGHRPRPLRVGHVALAALLGLIASGCALTSKSEPIAPRYFSPERAGEAGAASPRDAGPRGSLRLGRVTGASFLDDRLVFRDAGHELGYYEERRWTEEPARYVARRLARVLFEERGIRQVVGGSAPTLDVELTAFEEIRRPKPVARVAVVVKLHDQRVVLWGESFAVEQPIVPTEGGDPPDAAVDALALALRAAVDRIADRVLIELASLPVVDGSGPRGQVGAQSRIKVDAEAPADPR